MNKQQAKEVIKKEFCKVSIPENNNSDAFYAICSTVRKRFKCSCWTEVKTKLCPSCEFIEKIFKEIEE